MVDRSVSGWCASLLVAIGAASCTGEARVDAAADVEVLPRRGRFGSIRDLVLVGRVPARAGEALFVDRFEATQADWTEFATTAAGRAVDAREVRLVGGGSLPVAGMDLLQARAFARWRFGRLPSEAEWRAVTAGDGPGPFPWGSGMRDATRANTGDLGLGETVPVGTFESGRKDTGNAPYDLIGNVREWTETVPTDWCRSPGLDVRPAYLASWRVARKVPALSTWAIAGMLPPGLVVGVGGADVPRKVVGADFATPTASVVGRRDDVQFAGERSQRTGLRVYTTAAELLARLLACESPVEASERRG
ncbi:MAG TPA: hypothetical protein ENI87_00390, partial [bacterium]|nr:hypothetical protein [bacterium]